MTDLLSIEKKAEMLDNIGFLKPMRSESHLPDKSATKGKENPDIESVTLQILLELRKMNPHVAFQWDDKGMAQLFGEVTKRRLRYNATAKEWFWYTGKVWKVDNGGMEASRLIKFFIDALSVYAVSIADEKTKGDYQKFILKYRQYRNRNSLLLDARDVFYFVSSDLDRDGNLYNCLNGTFDLVNLKLRPHNPDDLLSRISNVEFDVSAQCKKWEKFLSEVMMGNDDKIRYLQRLCGYALTTQTVEENFHILYGSSTRNGKSCMVETLAYMHGGDGGYALSIQPESLAQKPKDSRAASSDIARLRGCRYLSCCEPPKRMLFDSSLLKSLLGRDTITARGLYEHEQEFQPSFKLFVTANTLPVVADESLFSSGRVRVITFNRHFSEEEQDKTLKDQLRQEAEISGIFNWCVDGLILYRAEGLNPPIAIREATQEYHEVSDKLQAFFTECLTEKPGGIEKAGDLYKAYSSWSKENGYGTESKSNFFTDLKGKQLFAATGTIDGKTFRNVVTGYSLNMEYAWSRM